ncbi:hypothetical protein AAY72_04235 [Alishewanella sp. WH16-1]|uniref:TIGR03016 family PEP-CTERM system-associated outer membrane protein n=1 Tax=Alishewanella sp. WH16-1 TaxID=1651088 RepID=UPI00070C3649|nr:TIGR03016 family PEP-CTERM system-associated outer membrane protein [Alishewanella sp. WH16-1]KRS22223.1 hypothetical protein AAY72_04235 [Alishewanella sp. WH16-1]
MGTIMARVRTFGSKRYWLCPAMTVLPLALVGPQAIAAESLFDASLKSAVYGYQLETAEQSNKTDDLVWELAPTINWQRQSAAMKTRINWRHETLFYNDAQPDKRSFNEFDFNNQISFFRERLIWSLDASQAYQIRDSRLGIFSDKITGAENLSKTNRYGSGLLFRNLRSAKYRTELDLSYRNYDSAAAEVDDGLLSYRTEAYDGRWLFGTNDRGLNFFWQYNGNIQRAERSTDNNVSGLLHGLVVGVPFAPKFSVIGRAGSERLDNGREYDNSFDYFGAGVEFRFGARSRINVTMNRSDSEAFGQRKETDTYAASQFLIAPTRRTSLEGSFDRRYFGRTWDLQGKYDLRFLSMRLRISDNVRTQNQFDRELEDLGIFVCPVGSTDLSGCFKPPTDKYMPVFGETLLQVRGPNSELREELVEQRNLSLTVAYSKNRLNASITLSDTELRYVESGDFSTNQGAALQLSWKLTEHSQLLANVNYYDIDYRNENRKDENLSASVSYQQQLTKRSDLRFTIRRLDRNSSIAEFDNSENRVWMEYTYKF